MIRETRSLRTVLAGLFMFLTCMAVTAQENIQFSQGMVDEGLSNTFSIPLMNYKGRGSDLPIVLNYSSNVWRIDNIITVENQQFKAYQTMTQAIYAEHSTAGWKSSLDLPKVEWPKTSDKYWSTGAVCNSGCDRRIAKVTIHMPDGSSHELRESDTPHTGLVDKVGIFYAVDGSRLRYDSTGSTTGTLYTPDGTRYVLNGTSGDVIDANGNTRSYNGTTRQWTDTLGRPIPHPIPAVPAPTDYPYTVPGLDGVHGANGGEQTYTFKWRELDDTLTTSTELRYIASHYLPYPSSTPTNDLGNNFPQEQSSQYDSLFSSGYADGAEVITMLVGKGQSGGQLFNPVVLSEIVLPDGRSYKFSYNIFGEIDKVIYPTGAYEQYQIQELGGAYNLSEPYDQVERGVVNRILSIDGSGINPLEWTYSRAEGSGAFRYRTVSPDTSCTDIYKLKLEPPIHGSPGYKQYWDFGFIDPRNGATVETRQYAASTTPCSGSPLRRELTEYERTVKDVMTLENGWHIYAYRNMRPTRKTTVILEGSGSALAQTTTFSYDTTNEYTTGVDQTFAYSYDFAVISNSTAQSGTIGQISAGNLAKYVATTYVSDANYTARNILGLVSQTIVKNPSGVAKAKTQIEYDDSNYSLASSGTMPSVAAGSWTDPVTELGSTVGSKRGLPTTVRSFYDLTNGYSIETHSFFDQFGNVRKSRDGKGYDTETLYDDEYAFAYPTKVITPVPGGNGSTSAFETTTTYDYDTGLPLTSTDANGGVTAMYYNDDLLRPTRVVAANGAETITIYGDGLIATNSLWVTTQQQIDSSRWKESKISMDGLGRTIKAESMDSDGDVIVETKYDNMGRVEEVSNPYRVGETVYWTANTYDSLGRTLTVTAPESSPVETTYSLSTSGSQIGTVVTVEDQADKLRRSITNAFGQLIRVDEPDNSNDLGSISSPKQATVYGYDLLNNLTSVTQGSQSRTFAYDALSRLTSASNPEAGTITYAYDANNNLTNKTDARGITTAYTYDTLNRVNQRSYATPTATPTPGTYQTTPTVTYYYDNTSVSNSKGRLTKVTSSVSTTEYTAFDILGRLTASKQTTDGVTYGNGSTDSLMTYSYNLRGDLIEQQYPSGRVVRNVLDDNGDLSLVQSKKTASAGYWNYAQNFTYNAAGAVTSMQLGNGTWEKTVFNPRLQPKEIALGRTSGATNLLKLEYSYGDWVSGSINAAKNNGNIVQQVITVPNTLTVGSNAFVATQKYYYDSLNRIDDATEHVDGNQTWRQDFQYDRYGNRNFVEPNTTTIPRECGTSPNLTICASDQNIYNPTINSANNNRIDTGEGYSFDTAGNTTGDAQGRKFTYDGENKQVVVKNASNVTIGEYWYDGDGKRVKKKAYDNTTGILTEETIFVYDAGGKLIEEYSTNVADPGDAEVAYLTNDHLGSPRINTDRDGDVISRHDYHPFGEEISTNDRSIHPQYTPDSVRKQFTGYELDSESALDFAQARYYSRGHGRFTTVDPLQASGKPSNPQTLNRYAYVLNSPCALTDSTGMIVDDCPPSCPTFEAGLGGSDSAVIASVTISMSGLPEELVPTSSGPDMSELIASRSLAPTLDVANAPPLASVEGIAQIAEAGSSIPGIGIPFAVVAGITRAGQGNASDAGLNLAGAIPGFGAFRKVQKADDIADGVKYIGRLEDLKNIPPSQTLLGDLPDLGSPKANYYQNMSVLRKALRDGYTIRDASFFRPDSELAPTLLRPDRTIRQTFLGAERLLLRNRGLLE